MNDKNISKKDVYDKLVEIRVRTENDCEDKLSSAHADMLFDVAVAFGLTETEAYEITGEFQS